MTAQETYDLYKEIRHMNTPDSWLLIQIINNTRLYKKNKSDEEYSDFLLRERNRLIRVWNDTHDDIKIIEPFNEEDLK
jgi:hypothetical protein